MKYIRNNLNYFVKFRTGNGSGERTYIFPCETRYRDTNEIAQTGVTELTDVDFELLKTENQRFCKALENGELTETVKPLVTVEAVKEAAKEEVAKEQVKTKEAEAKAEALEAEVKSLKEQLEAMAKKRTRKPKETEESVVNE